MAFLIPSISRYILVLLVPPGNGENANKYKTMPSSDFPESRYLGSLSYNFYNPPCVTPESFISRYSGTTTKVLSLWFSRFLSLPLSIQFIALGFLDSACPCMFQRACPSYISYTLQPLVFIKGKHNLSSWHLNIPSTFSSYPISLFSGVCFDGARPNGIDP